MEKINNIISLYINLILYSTVLNENKTGNLKHFTSSHVFEYQIYIYLSICV